MSAGDSNGAVRSPRSVMLDLAIILLLVVPPLFIEVQRPAPTRIMETLSFLTSQETWLRMHHGEPDAWKRPTWNGQPRIQKPPMLIWLNLLVWKGLSPEHACVEDLVARARWLAAGLAVVAVLAVYGIGRRVGGGDVALAGSLATGLSVGFIRQARYASYDTHLMAWVAIAVLCAVWACCLPRGAVWRRMIGWGGAALFLTMTNYTKGPLGLVLVAPAWIAAIVQLSSNRRRDAEFAAAAVALAVCALALWFGIAHSLTPHAGELLRDEYGYIFEQSRNVLFYVVLLGLIFPWTLWLAGGVIWPWWRRDAREPRTGVFFWTWFVAVFILLSLAPVKNKRYLAPIFPAAGLLTAYTWLELQGLALIEKNRVWIRRLGAMHWGALSLATVLLPVFAALEPSALAHGLLRRATFGGAGWILWTIAPVLLIPLLLAGIAADRRRRGMAAMVLTAAWFSAAATFGFYAYARTSRQQYAYREDAERLAELARRTPVYYISRFQPPSHEAMPGHELLIYFRGIIPPIGLNDILERAANNDRFMVLTRLNAEEERRLTEAGLCCFGEIRDGRLPDWKLFGNVDRLTESER